MSMSKKDFIALADAIKTHNDIAKHIGDKPFSQKQLGTIGDFCKSQNGNFMRERWLGYIAGTKEVAGSLIEIGKQPIRASLGHPRDNFWMAFVFVGCNGSSRHRNFDHVGYDLNFLSVDPGAF